MRSKQKKLREFNENEAKRNEKVNHYLNIIDDIFSYTILQENQELTPTIQAHLNQRAI